MSPQAIEQQVQDLHEAGYSIRGIASKLDLSFSKVRDALQKPNNPLTPTQQEQTCQPGSPTDIALRISHQTGNSEVIKRSDPHGKASTRPYDRPVPLFNPFFTCDSQRLLACLNHIMNRIDNYKQESDAFVLEMINLHNGKDVLERAKYSRYYRRAKRLLANGNLLVEQLGGQTKSLLLFHILESIINTMQRILVGDEKVWQYGKHLFLSDRKRSLPVWRETLKYNCLTPISNKQWNLLYQK